MDFVHEFYQKCFTLTDKTIKKLTLDLQNKMNQRIDKASLRSQQNDV